MVDGCSIDMIMSKIWGVSSEALPVVCSAYRVGFFNNGSGRVLDKIPGSGSGSGRVGVSKYAIGFFWVSFLLSGISGYFGYFRVCRVFSGISGFTHIYLGYFLTFNQG